MSLNESAAHVASAPALPRPPDVASEPRDPRASTAGVARRSRRASMEIVAERLMPYVRPGEAHRPTRQMQMRAAVSSGTAALFLARRGIAPSGLSRASAARAETGSHPSPRSNTRQTLVSSQGHMDLRVQAGGPIIGDDPDDQRFERVQAVYSDLVPGYVRRVYLPWASAASSALTSLSPERKALAEFSPQASAAPEQSASRARIPATVTIVPDLGQGPPSSRLPSRVVYIASCARPAAPVVPLPQVVYGLDAPILSLRHRQLTDKDVLHVAIALRDGWSRCVALDVSGCRLSDWSAAALLDGLLTNEDVRAIDMSHNALGPRAQSALLRLLCSSDCVRHINLASCGLGDAFVTALFDAMCARKDLARTVPSLLMDGPSAAGRPVSGLPASAGGRRGRPPRAASSSPASRLGTSTSSAHGRRNRRLAVATAVTRRARVEDSRLRGNAEDAVPGRMALSHSAAALATFSGAAAEAGLSDDGAFGLTTGLPAGAGASLSTTLLPASASGRRRPLPSLASASAGSLPRWTGTLNSGPGTDSMYSLPMGGSLFSRGGAGDAMGPDPDAILADRCMRELLSSSQGHRGSSALLPTAALLQGTPASLMEPLRQRQLGITDSVRRSSAREQQRGMVLEPPGGVTIRGTSTPLSSRSTAMSDADGTGGTGDTDASAPPVALVGSQTDTLRFLVALTSPILPADVFDAAVEKLTKAADAAALARAPKPTPQRIGFAASVARNSASSQSLLAAAAAETDEAVGATERVPRTPLLAAAHRQRFARLKPSKSGRLEQFAQQEESRQFVVSHRSIDSLVGVATASAEARSGGKHQQQGRHRHGERTAFPLHSSPPRRDSSSPRRQGAVGPTVADSAGADGGSGECGQMGMPQVQAMSGAGILAQAPGMHSWPDLLLPSRAREALQRCMYDGQSAGSSGDDKESGPSHTIIAALGPYHGNVPLLPAGNRSLRSLVLAGNEAITSASTSLIAHMLGVDFGAKHVRPTALLEDLSLAWCPLGTSTRQLFEAVAMPPQRLTSLDLSFCGADDTADPGLSGALRTAIASNGSLRRVDLSHNALGEASAVALAEALLTNETLQTLLLGFNPMGVEGTTAILLAALVHPLLRELGLENCGAANGGLAGSSSLGASARLRGTSAATSGGRSTLATMAHRHVPLAGAAAGQALAQAKQEGDRRFVDNALRLLRLRLPSKTTASTAMDGDMATTAGGTEEAKLAMPDPAVWGEAGSQRVFDRAWRLKRLREGMIVTIEWPPSPRCFGGTPDLELAAVLGVPGAPPVPGDSVAEATQARLATGTWPLSVPREAAAATALLDTDDLVAFDDGEAVQPLPLLARLPLVRTAGADMYSHTAGLSASMRQARLRQRAVLDPLMWTPWNSIFADRPRDSDAADFVDPSEHLAEAFIVDWDSMNLGRFVRDAGALGRIKGILSNAYPILKETFRAYGLKNGATDPFDLSFSELRSLWLDMGLFEALPVDRSLQEAVLVICFSASNYSSAPGAFESGSSLSRPEFLELIVRVAIQTLIKQGHHANPDDKATAVKRFLEELLLPQLRRALNTRACVAAMAAADAGTVSVVGKPGHALTPGGCLIGANPIKQAQLLANPPPARGKPARAQAQRTGAAAAGGKGPTARQDPHRRGFDLDDATGTGGAGDDGSAELEAVLDPYGDGSGIDDGLEGVASSGSVGAASPHAASTQWLLVPEDVALPGFAFDRRKAALKRLTMMRANAFGMGKASHSINKMIAVTASNEVEEALDLPGQTTVEGNLSPELPQRLLLPGFETTGSSTGASPAGNSVQAATDRMRRVPSMALRHRPKPLDADPQAAARGSAKPAPLWAGEADIVSNAFRRLWLLREDVALLLERHRATINALFRLFSGRWAHADDGRRFMSLHEWLDMLEDSEVVPRWASAEQAAAAYVWSATTVRDESQRALNAVRTAHRRVGAELVDRHDQHTRSEFIESLCRLAAGALGINEPASRQDVKDEVLIVAAEVRRRLARRRQRTLARSDAAATLAGSLHGSSHRKQISGSVSIGEGRTEGAGAVTVHAPSPDQDVRPVGRIASPEQPRGMTTHGPEGPLPRLASHVRGPVGSHGAATVSAGEALIGAGSGTRPDVAMVEEDQQAIEWHPQRESLLEYLGRLEWLLRAVQTAAVSKSTTQAALQSQSRRTTGISVRDAAMQRYEAQAKAY